MTTRVDLALTEADVPARPGYGRAPRSEASLAAVMEANQVWGVNHPRYKLYTQVLTASLRAVLDREQERRAAAFPTLVTVGLSSAHLAFAQAVFPELSIRVMPTYSPGHGLWVAMRQCVNVLMARAIARYSGNYLHYGGTVLHSALHGFAGAHLEVDPGSALALHESHEYTCQATRLLSKPATIQNSLGVGFDPSTYHKFLSGSALATCTRGLGCRHRADAAIFDLTLYPMSVVQVVGAMLQSQAEIAYVVLPYHAGMLVSDEGELPEVGVHYQRTADAMIFKYPEGVAGVTRFPLSAYASWLVQHVVPLGAGQGGFQVELDSCREGMMIATVVRVASIPRVAVRHALDLPAMEDMVVVEGWAMRDLTADPDKSASWVLKRVMVSRRVLERVREHGLSLSREDFSKFAIRKRFEIANDRVVVQGTSVKLSPSLTSDQLDLLSAFVYAEVFNARFDMSNLSMELMAAVKELVGYGRLSSAARLGFVFSACVAGLWNHTLGPVDDWFRARLDGLRVLLGRVKTDRSPRYLVPPRFMLLTNHPQANAGFARVWEFLSLSVGAHPVEGGTMVGSSLAHVLQANIARRVPASESAVQCLVSSHITEEVLTSVGEGANTELKREILGLVRSLNEVGVGPASRHELLVEGAAPVSLEERSNCEYDLEPGYLQRAAEIHEAVCDGVATSGDYVYDTYSLSLDDQHRTLAAPYLRLPGKFADLPRDRYYFMSKVKGYNVAKRQATTQETLSAIAARNLTAPILSLPQDIGPLVVDVWEVFLNTMCVPDARRRLASFSTDVVGLDEQAYQDWMDKATPEALQKVRKHLQDTSDIFESMSPAEYVVMLKADVKPPVSDKPVNSRVEPQVIVYHEKAMSSLYSSLMRVLVRRFLSLLKPNVMGNLLKDMDGVRSHVNAHHQWGAALKYLENDFSKYDKSQSEVALALEEYVYKQLGLDAEMLSRWIGGHVKCSMRAVSLGISLSVEYQRKSGDAATAFGNLIINMMTVAYAYRGSEIVWGVFQGDDSICCVRKVAGTDEAVRLMGEVFNLQAKFFITDSPYFASNFLLVHDTRKEIAVLPDPIKRIEKWMVAVPGDFTDWEGKYASELLTCGPYLRRENAVGLEEAVAERYVIVPGGSVSGVASVLATAVSSFTRYRSIWDDKPTYVSA